MAPSSHRVTRWPATRSVRKRVRASTSGNSGTPRSSHARGRPRYGDPSCHSEEVGLVLGGARARSRPPVVPLVLCAALVSAALLSCVRSRRPAGRCGRHRRLQQPHLEQPRLEHDRVLHHPVDHHDRPRTSGHPRAVGAVRSAAVRHRGGPARLRPAPVGHDPDRLGHAPRLGSRAAHRVSRHRPRGAGGLGDQRPARRAGRAQLRQLLARFDIVEFDPRGVERSSPVHCSAGGSAASGPSTPGPLSRPGAEHHRGPAGAAHQRQRVRGAMRVHERRACFPSSGPSTPRATWTGSARRSATRSSPTSATPTAPCSVPLYAEMFPTHVRAMVLDGAIDPAMSTAADGRRAEPGIRSRARRLLHVVRVVGVPLATGRRRLGGRSARR